MAYRPYEAGEMASEEPASELASPWSRLAAVIIDGLIYLAVAIVAGIIGFVVGELAGAILLALLSALVLLIVQFVLLGSRGQTIGKIAMKVRIVDSVTGAHPGWARIILLRTVVNGILIGIPFVGYAYFLVDSLFIFREDHRTIHDMIASTRVDRVAG